MTHIVSVRSPTCTGRMADAVVLIDNSNQIAALLLVHGGLRNQQGILLHANHGADLAVLPGTQDIAGIWKQSGQLDRAGVLIHLAIREIEFAFLRIGGSIGEDELQLPVIFRLNPKTAFATRDIPVR